MLIRVCASLQYNTNYAILKCYLCSTYCHLLHFSITKKNEKGRSAMVRLRHSLMSKCVYKLSPDIYSYSSNIFLAQIPMLILTINDKASDTFRIESLRRYITYMHLSFLINYETQRYEEM